jgi:hypothetical protein
MRKARNSRSSRVLSKKLQKCIETFHTGHTRKHTFQNATTVARERNLGRFLLRRYAAPRGQA